MATDRRPALHQGVQVAIHLRLAARVDQGKGRLFTSDFTKAQALLKEAGYDGTPVVLMQSTDLKALTNLAPVAKSLMEKAGFKVDMQAMDWQTLVARRAKKDPPNAGGWNAFLTAWVAADMLDPVSTAYLNASCDKASFGWPCDAELEKLRDDFARKPIPRSRRRSPKPCSCARIETTPTIPVGQYVQPQAIRKNVKGFVLRRRRCSGTSKSEVTSAARAGRFLPPAAFEGRANPCHDGYILRRLLATIPVMLIVAVFVFLMLRLTPRDPAAIIAGDNANSEQVAQIRQQLGLDQPMFSSSSSGPAVCCPAISARASSSRRRWPS